MHKTLLSRLRSFSCYPGTNFVGKVGLMFRTRLAPSSLGHEPCPLNDSIAWAGKVVSGLRFQAARLGLPL